jgi:hypothetical protein
MFMNPVGLRTKNHCAGEGQQQFSSQSISSAKSTVSCRLECAVSGES